ncbi:MAG: DUF3788 family protein [Chloroflexota bacterium]
MHERMMDKTTQPSDADMVNWIGRPIAEGWIALRRFLAETYAIDPIFNSGGKCYGWNLQHPGITTAVLRLLLGKAYDRRI